MSWITSAPQERRKQFGPFLLGTGNIGGIATTTGPRIGLSDAAGLDLIDRAAAEGVKILDTADVYTGGNSERVVGIWNRSHPDSGLLIQSKTGMTADGPDLSPDQVTRQLQRSIDTLGRVDLYVAHAVDPGTRWSPGATTYPCCRSWPRRASRTPRTR